MTAGGAARGWADHWSAGPPELAQRFNRLVEGDLLPLMEMLGLSVRGDPVNHGSLENRVFSFEVGGGERVLIKLYRPGRWGLAALADEVELLHELHAAGVPVVRPIASRLGGDVGTWSGIHFVLFEYVPTCPRRSETWGPRALRELGHLAARMHEVSMRHDAPHRVHFEPRGMGYENLDYFLGSGLLPEDLVPEYRAIGLEIIERSIPLLEGVPRIRVHGDFGVHNLLHTARGWVIADFDDFAMAPAVFDLCRLHIKLTTPWGNPEADRAIRDRTTPYFVEGYREVRPLPDEDLRPLEALRALRMLWNDAWKRGRLHDPLFREVRRAVFEREFWLPRMAYLRDQLACLRR